MRAIRLARRPAAGDNRRAAEPPPAAAADSAVAAVHVVANADVANTVAEAVDVRDNATGLIIKRIDVNQVAQTCIGNCALPKVTKIVEFVQFCLHPMSQSCLHNQIPQRGH